MMSDWGGSRACGSRSDLPTSPSETSLRLAPTHQDIWEPYLQHKILLPRSPTFVIQCTLTSVLLKKKAVKSSSQHRWRRASRVHTRWQKRIALLSARTGKWKSWQWLFRSPQLSTMAVEEDGRKRSHYPEWLTARLLRHGKSSRLGRW